MWQDIILTVVNVLFGYALIPQVYQGFKNKKSYINFQTGLISSLGLYVVAFIYFTFNLIFSTIVASFNATMWLILFIQTFIYRREL